MTTNRVSIWRRSPKRVLLPFGPSRGLGARETFPLYPFSAHCPSEGKGHAFLEHWASTETSVFLSLGHNGSAKRGICDATDIY